MEKAEKIPSLDVVWQVQTGSRVVTERTPFERIEIIPTYDVYGGPYWYDPFYPDVMFYGAVVPPPFYIRRPVIIDPPRARRIR